MRKVSQTAAEIVELSQAHIDVCMTFDSADSEVDRNNTKISEWFLLSSDNAEVHIVIVEDREHFTHDYLSLSVTVKRV